MYRLRDRPRWRTVRGGSRSYVDAIVTPWRDLTGLRHLGQSFNPVSF